MGLSGLLVLLLMALVIPSLGCSGQLEPRSVEDVEQPQCDQLERYRGRSSELTQRFHWYRARVGVGEQLPATVQSKGDSASVSYVVRTSQNEEVDEGFDTRSIFLGVQVVFTIGVFILLMMVPVVAIGVKAGDFKKSTLWRTLGATLIAIALTVGSSYLGGSVVAIDNASAADVVVTIDGTEHELPADHFVNVRMTGSTFDLQVKSGDQTIETVRLEPDDGAGDTLWRMLWGNGRFYYSVCGYNRISLGEAEYGS